MDYKQQALDFLGVTLWHSKGYKGKGIIIVNGENVFEKNNQDVLAPLGYASKKGHGDNVLAHIRLVCPEATIVSCPINGSFSDKGYTSKGVDYIKSIQAHVYTDSSLGEALNAGEKMALQDIIDSGCIMCIASGNDGDKGLRGESQDDHYWAIGGVKPVYNGKEYDFANIKRVTRSSYDKYLDFVTLAEILGVSGTSFCSPVFASMLALVQQAFIEKIGRRLTREEMFNFVKTNCIDTHEEGFDIETGYGLFVLPDPDTIKISDYVAEVHEGIDYTGFPEVRSDVKMRGIDKLHPQMQKACNKFLEECQKQDLNVLITETLRTQAEQEALYAQGRTTPGNIVTNARGYSSPHCWGVAFDFCRNVKGKEYDNSDGFFDKVGKIAKTIFDNTEYDLFWGGDFKSFVDKPHIEMIKFLPNNSTKWLVSTYGTPDKFMETWNESEVEEMRYKTVEEMPEWAREPIQNLIDKGILSGRGGDAGLDLSDDMVRVLILAQKIFETK